MRKENSINPQQLPEWKKEVAEKVKAYGERKKRLTTPPNPLKPNQESSLPQNPPVKQVIPLPEKSDQPASPSPAVHQRIQLADPGPETAPPSPFDIWTDDVSNISLAEDSENTQSVTSGSPYLFRRIFAGIIDHCILGAAAWLILFISSFLIGESMRWFLVSGWKASFSLILLMHFLYNLYFLRASRQTPGMLFLSLELRDPVIPVIPFGKIMIRWAAFVFLNVFNFLPLALGRKVLLLDQLSGTEVRSFK